MLYISVRLVNGADGYEGRVEILHEGSWGTVCDDLWDLDDAKVVCRQLEFDGALAALPQSRFGQGSGDIFLDGVQCNGTETNLKDCKHKGIGVHYCYHKEDASVICRHGGNTINPSLKKKLCQKLPDTYRPKRKKRAKLYFLITVIEHPGNFIMHSKHNFPQI